MAMLDYGAIAFKNSKCISTGFFTPMETTCGWSDDENPLWGESSFDGNEFVVCGDKDFVIGFYKTSIKWWTKETEEWYKKEDVQEPYYEWFGSSDYKGWKKWTKNIEGMACIIVKPRNGYFVATWEYKGDKYKVYFGYGVDFNTYKRWHIVNYYRSIPHFFKTSIPNFIRYDVSNWLNAKIWYIKNK
jgi:hypothetical protein